MLRTRVDTKIRGKFWVGPQSKWGVSTQKRTFFEKFFQNPKSKIDFKLQRFKLVLLNWSYLIRFFIKF